MDKSKLWEAVLARLSDKISRMEFFTWFNKVCIAEIQGGAIVIACPTEMNKNWLETKYKGIILSNIKAIAPEIDKVFYVVNLSLADQNNSSEIFARKTEKPRKLPNQPVSKFSDGTQTRPTQEKHSLQNFIVGAENKFAYVASQKIVEDASSSKKSYNPFFIYGGVGLGKTHLLQGIANEIKTKKPNLKVIYTTAERYMNEIVKAISMKKTDDFRKKYRQVDVFILDDIQFFENKDKTQEELFNTFNDLFEFNKQIVFSADRPPSELLGISDRLRSRMGWGLLADVKMPGIETRLAIIQSKSQELSLILPIEVQKFIAEKIHTSLRELENILHQIKAEIEIENISPTVQTIARIFRKIYPQEDLLKSAKNKNAIAKNSDDVISSVSDYFQVPTSDLLGTSRKSGIVMPRQICWTLCKDILKMSFESIGFVFGGKNHTTIMHGIRKINSLLRSDSATARHIHTLKKELGI